MANTTPDNLYYPVGTDGISPLQTILANMQGSTQTALSALGTKFPAVANSDAARNALFPSPVQGNRVFRSDRMYTEAYFSAWTGANPAGAKLAGWYPIDSHIYGKVTRDTAIALGNANADFKVGFESNLGTYTGMWNGSGSTRLNLPIVGVWEVEGFSSATQLDGGVLRSTITLNGAASTQGDLRDNVSSVSGVTDPFVKPRGVVNITNTTSYVELVLSSGGRQSAFAVGMTMWAKYLGPERSA